MKKLLIIAAAAALALAGCNKAHKAEEVAADQTAKAEDIMTGTSTGTVEDLTNDSIFRPDTKVDRLTVLDFNATWCGPCKELTPVYHQAAAEFPEVRFVSVDVDRNHATADAFHIEAVPTVIFLKPDGTSEQFVGTQDLLPYSTFEALIQKNLK